MESASLLASSAQLSQAVIRLINRAGNKRSDKLDVNEDESGQRKIRRTQSHLMPDSIIVERRPRSVIMSPQVPPNRDSTNQKKMPGSLFLGTSSTECNKNFVFSADPQMTVSTNENGLFTFRMFNC